MILTLVQALVDERQPGGEHGPTEGSGADILQAVGADRRRRPESGDAPSGWHHEMAEMQRLNARLIQVLTPEQRRQMLVQGDES